MTDAKGLIEKPTFATPSTETGVKTVGLESLQEYQVLAYGKVVQSMTKAPIKPPAKEGDLVVLPENIILLPHGEQLNFVTIFAYQEYLVHNPIQVKGLPFIRDRSFDKKSEIAQRAKSRNPNEREEPCPENPQFPIKYCEHLKFVILPLDHNETFGKDRVFVIDFSVGNWKYGVNFISLLKARNASHICACQFALFTSLRPNASGDYYGIDVTQPSDVSPWVQSESDFNRYVAMHDAAKTTFEASGISAYDEVEDTSTFDVNTGSF